MNYYEPTCTLRYSQAGTLRLLLVALLAGDYLRLSWKVDSLAQVVIPEMLCSAYDR